MPIVALTLLLLQATLPKPPFPAPRCGSEMTVETRVQPVFPEKERLAGTQGQVELEALVSASGEVKDVAVVSGEPALAEAATAAVKQWKYRPCDAGGKPIEATTLVRVNFALQPQRVRVSGGVTAGNLVHSVKPTYPPGAKMARIQGAVVLHVVIGKDGTMQKVEVVSGHPMLVEAAVDAIKQWRYKPYLLYGKPVEVDTTVTVNFQP